ncbi:hypothetical protein BDA96_10G142300 [Sorghum bicolor]|nr:hypothetical protein BDA96_10G142300 [Sorghum bicolor]
MRAGADLVQGAVVGSGTATEAVVVREADGNNRSQPPPPSLPLSVWPCETSMTSAGVRRGGWKRKARRLLLLP